jgi:hypothetical protein
MKCVRFYPRNETLYIADKPITTYCIKNDSICIKEHRGKNNKMLKDFLTFRIYRNSSSVSHNQ